MARAGLSYHGRHFISRFVLLFLTLGLLVPALAGCFSTPAATPPGALAYEGPQTYTLKPGDPIPGTDIRYVGKTGEGAEFLVAGQRAVKQAADSLNWSGSPAAGVKLDLRLRVVWFTQDALYAAGTAKVTVSDVAPQAGQLPAGAPLSYQAPVSYGVPLESMVPGTTLTYVGKDAEGAKFGGVDGYPYRQSGDSLRWEGQLRPNVAVRMELRVVQYDEQSAKLVGLAHLSVTP